MGLPGGDVWGKCQEDFSGNLWGIFIGNVGECFAIFWWGYFPGEFVKKVNAELLHSICL